MRNLLICVIAIVLISLSASAQKSKKNDTINHYQMNEVKIFSQKNNPLKEIPGSANIISSSELKISKAFSGNEVFRAVSGVNVVDEEGAGLRLNMGIRGLDPDRSRSLLILEDGVPVALAPYGEPELYYTPNMDRMKEVEILKGSGSILYGPQTIGGVVNYITAMPPSDTKTNIAFMGGEGGFLRTKLAYGSGDYTKGFMIEMNHKQADKIGLTRFGINDLMAKFRYNLSQNSILNFKVGVYDENSNSTYVGLTQTMYDNGEYFQEIAKNDKLDVRRYSANINHTYFFTNNMTLSTQLFGYTTSRNWLRQDFSSSSTAKNMTGQIFGDTSVAGGAIYMLNSTGQRNRQFEVIGIQPTLNANFEFLDMKNNLTLGFRYLHERAYEQSVNGTTSQAQSGNLALDEIRNGEGYSAFLQDRIFLSDDVILSPGVRFEYFDYDRTINRVSSKDTLISGGGKTSAFIPGLGISYTVVENNTLYAGIHKGFAPPRVKDAITGSGVSLELDAEHSWNSEIGIRSRLLDFLYIDLTAYYLDFSNQIIPVSQSSGAAGNATGYVNGGSTVHQGLEIAAIFDFNSTFDSEDNLNLNLNATVSNSEYSSDRFVGTNKSNVKGNRLPYSTELSANFSIIYSIADFKFKTCVNYVGDQFADELNTVSASANGQIGLIKEHFVFDATISYFIDIFNAEAFITAKNISDEIYIASRRPQGIKVGVPRTVYAGLDFTF